MCCERLCWKWLRFKRYACCDPFAYSDHNPILLSPWYNRTGWLGVKNQFTDLSCLSSFPCRPSAASSCHHLKTLKILLVVVVVVVIYLLFLFRLWFIFIIRIHHHQWSASSSSSSSTNFLFVLGCCCFLLLFKKKKIKKNDTWSLSKIDCGSNNLTFEYDDDHNDCRDYRLHRGLCLTVYRLRPCTFRQHF